MKLNLSAPQFDKQTGLITIVVIHVPKNEQSALPGGAILMVAHANEEAYRLTLSTGYAHFWSRSRNSLWKKGETSGNVIPVYKIVMDCDRDTVLYFTEVGLENFATCHLGSISCFGSCLIGNLPDLSIRTAEYEVHESFTN
ncbi:MAG: phosphoribosyl-AMP cyclohydrolase [Candidatus Doudnabacteria bacterium]|nr:phosphoribosyl-AMP cyclohydrolase [Candidatus Doudnabacteria bacterium]